MPRSKVIGTSVDTAHPRHPLVYTIATTRFEPHETPILELRVIEQGCGKPNSRHLHATRCSLLYIGARATPTTVGIKVREPQHLLNEACERDGTCRLLDLVTTALKKDTYYIEERTLCTVLAGYMPVAQWLNHHLLAYIPPKIIERVFACTGGSSCAH